MISSKDVNQELNAIDEMAKINKDDLGNTKIVVFKSMLKALGLLVKLVRDIRSNQVRAMEAQGFQLIKDHTVKKQQKDGDVNAS